MPTLELRFPAGHFHATPSWGHHVNEGLIEWPPSPWRLLRTLIATGYTKRHWQDPTPPPVAVSLLHKLASVLPSYALPAASGAHTRHYMPQGTLDKDRGVENTALVFDAFAHGLTDAMLVYWPVELTVDEREMFGDLAAHVSYVGRAESWTDARLLPSDPLPERVDCVACEPNSFNRRGFEQVSLLAPETQTNFDAWLDLATAEAIATSGIDRTQKKLTATQKKKLDAATEPLPKSLMEALQSTTSFWRKHGWSQPPGSRKVLYWRPTHAIQVAPAIQKRTEFVAAPIECILLSLATSTHNQHALPMRSQSLNQCERLHRRLVGIASKQLGDCPAELTGRDAQRRPLKTPHQHAHVLALDLDGDQRIDHFLIYAPMCLSGASQQAIRLIRQAHTKGQRAMRLAMAAKGNLAELGNEIAELVPLVGPARRWLSTTPFVPPRFLKKSGTNTLEGQIKSELAVRGFSTDVAVRIIAVNSDDPYANEARQQRHFKRIRRKLSPKQDAAFTVELLFETEVEGPIALGYASHFGLGLFVAMPKPP